MHMVYVAFRDKYTILSHHNVHYSSGTKPGGVREYLRQAPFDEAEYLVAEVMPTRAIFLCVQGKAA